MQPYCVLGGVLLALGGRLAKNAISFGSKLREKLLILTSSLYHLYDNDYVGHLSLLDLGR